MMTPRPFCNSLSVFFVLAFLAACRENTQPPTGTVSIGHVDQPVSSSVTGMVVARVASFSEDSVIVTWCDTDSNRSSYVVERTNADGNEFIALATVQSHDVAYLDIGKKEVLHTYSYRIVAMTRSGDQTFSNVVPLYLNPRRPLAVRPTHISATTVQLQWDFTGNICDGFIIERSIDGSSYDRIGATARNQHLFEDATLDTSVVYYYRAFTVTRYTIGPSSVPIKIAYILNPLYHERQWMMIS